MLNKLHLAAALLVGVGLVVMGSSLRAQGTDPAPPVAAEVQDAASHDEAGGGHEDAGGDVTAENASAQAEGGHADATHADATHADAANAPAGHEGEAHGESIWATVARFANFAILLGGLYYFLRVPFGEHLSSRGEQIRGDLRLAAQMKADAAVRLAEIEQRLAGLPAELVLVTQRGAEEVEAEEARMAGQVNVERERLMAQARREIDQQVRTARHALKAQAASLAVTVAENRLRDTLTAAEQQRLADEFSAGIGAAR